MEYYSAIKKNSFESILMRWMKLEPIIQSEVSQKDKDHYNILTHIYDPLYFSVVCCHLSIFISDFVNLVLLPLFLNESC